MNSQILSNIDIELLCQKFGIKLNGCVSKDMLNDLPLENGGYIINLENSDKDGSHWVGLYIRDRDAVYFDPFGVQYPTQVQTYCKSKKLIYNETQVQEISQECCGWYCISFLHFMSKNVIKINNIDYYLNRFFNLFNNTNYNSNDNILQNYFKVKILKLKI